MSNTAPNNIELGIGELAELSGLPVKTVRYYSDIGLVPESSRTASGYRRYDAGSVLRLDLVRTLRDLGLDLATVRQVLEHRATLAEVAAAHADALDTQIRTLRLHRSILRAVAKRNPTTEELTRMRDIARATADERRRIINEFLDSIFAGVPVDPEFEAMMRRAQPDLPDDPSPEQVEAWVELATLVADEDFRRTLREMGARTFGADGRQPLFTDHEVGRRVMTLIGTRAGEAVAQGIAPDSTEATAIVNELVAAYAEAGNTPDSADFRGRLLSHLEAGNDPRAARYWELMALINGWPPRPEHQETAKAFQWFITALGRNIR